MSVGGTVVSCPGLLSACNSDIPPLIQDIFYEILCGHQKLFRVLKIQAQRASCIKGLVFSLPQEIQPHGNTQSWIYLVGECSKGTFVDFSQQDHGFCLLQMWWKHLWFFSISGLIFLMGSVQSQIENEPEVGDMVPLWTIYLVCAKEGPCPGKNKTVTKIFP